MKEVPAALPANDGQRKNEQDNKNGVLRLDDIASNVLLIKV